MKAAKAKLIDAVPAEGQEYIPDPEDDQELTPDQKARRDQYDLELEREGYGKAEV